MSTGILDMNTFTTLDIAGNEVTEEIFKDYDLTMITICADATDSLDLAKDILKSADAKFITLRNNEEIEKKLLNYVVEGYPK